MRFTEAVTTIGRAKLAGAGFGIATILAAVLGLAWVMKSCAPEPAPKIPPKTQRAIDSLNMTKPNFDSMQVAGREQVARDTIRATGHKQEATRAEATANFAKLTADSLAETAAKLASSDSAALAWKDAYEARTREADAWHVAAVRNDSAYRAERDARLVLTTIYEADTLRRHAVEAVNVELQKAIGKLQQPCRIVGPIPCPNRTVTMVGSVVLGAVAGAALKR